MSNRFLTTALVFVFCCSAWATKRYCTPAGSLSNNGASWADATSDIQKIINASSSGDTVWVAAGTYYPNRRADATGTITNNDRSNSFVLKSGVKVLGGFAGTETYFSQRNISSNTTILSGDLGTPGTSTDNVYHVVISSGGVVGAVLDGFTITGGYGETNVSLSVNGNSVNSYFGSGIHCISSSPTLSNLIIQNNTSNSGGAGIYLNGSSASISNCTIQSNALLNNQSLDSEGGAGIFSTNNSTPTITGSTIKNNSSLGYGGGIFNLSSSPTISNTTFDSNTASKNGGGIYNKNGSAMTLTNVILKRNRADNKGGAIWNGTTLTATNVLIYKNASKQNGAAIYSSSNTATITNSTIVYNTASSGYCGGIEGSFTVNNSIIWGNLGETVSNNTSGSITYNYCLLEGGTVSGTGIVSISDPLFVNSNADDYRLQASSPAKDRGNNSFISSVTSDLDGMDRIINSTVDLGAYEYTGVLYVKKGSTGTNGLSWGDALGELSDAIAKANTANTSSPGSIGSIWVAAGTYYPLYNAGNGSTNSDKAFVLPNNVKIYGGFAGGETSVSQRNISSNTTILSGDLGTPDTSTDNAYHVVISSGDVGTAELNGFTITKGNAQNGAEPIVNGTKIYSARGGGIYCASSSPILSNLIVTSNTADYLGGGINIESSSSPTISYVTFRSNTSGQQGGGVYNASTGTVSITNSIFTANYTLYRGGAINNTGTTLTLTNILAYKNTSGQSGAAIYSSSNTPTITNSTIVYNTASSENGGGVDGNFTINNSIIWGNLVGSTLNNTSGTITYNYCLLQSGTVNGNTIISNTNPRFVSTSADNYQIPSWSPAVNAGNNSYNSTTTDLAGNARTYNGTIDLGAYECQSAPTVLAKTRIIYVKKTATGSNDGSSWTNAFTELSDALLESDNSGTVAQIWVAAGTYIPTRFAGNGSNSGDKSFVLQKDVAIYGGFAGTETQLSQRNFVNNPTILSGDNVMYHVVLSVGDVGTAVLDGFSVMSGTATSTSLNIVNNKTITNSWGGGIFCNASSPTFSNVKIYSNTCLYLGAAVYCASSSSPTFINTLIYKNTAGQNAGGIYSDSSNPVLINCTVVNNTGGGSTGISGTATVKNSIIWGNTVSGSITYNNTLLQGGTAGVNGIVSNTNPRFVSVSADNYQIPSWSPAVNAGNNSYNSTTTDLAGNTRTYNGTIDLGAYECQSAPTVLTKTRTIYVKKTDSGTNDGSSWTNAFTELSDALSESDNSGTVAQIWVAAGTYIPTKFMGNGTYAGDKSFVLQKDVAIYGGFAGTETALSERNIAANVTILSGNSTMYHVVVSAGDAGTAVLDGFSITGASSNNWNDITLNSFIIKQSRGAGVHCNASSPIFKNIKIYSNSNPEYGGAVYCGSNSSPTFINVLMYKNNASNGGGGIYSDSSNPTLINCTVVNNTGGGSTGISGTATVKNSIIWGNSVSGTITYNYTLLQNETVSGTSIISNADPLFVDNSSDNYRLQASSPAKNVGNNSYVPSSVTSDLDGVDRIIYGTVDLGAYEYSQSNKWVGSVSTDPANAQNWSQGVALGSNEFLEFDGSAQRDLLLTADKTISSLYNHSSRVVNTNGHKLTLTGNVDQSSTITAAVAGSTVEFAGTSAQSISAGMFTNDSVCSLIVNNPSNVVASGNLRLANNITATSGKLDVFTNSASLYYSGQLLDNVFLNNRVYKLTLYNTSGYTPANDLVVSNNLVLGRNVVFTINPGVMLNVGGSITNNKGVSGMIVKASTGLLPNGSLIFHNASNNPLSATVEMYSKAFKDLNGPTGFMYKWQFFGIPVKTITADPTFYGSYVSEYNATSSTNSWTSLTNNSVLTSFKGYEITQLAAKTITFQGTLENADMNINLPYNSGALYPGQHIVANPYTAAINIANISFTNCDGSVYQYNTGSKADWSGYQGVTNASHPGQYIASTVNTAGEGGIPATIPSMQGFLVKANSGGGTISYSYNSLSAKNSDAQRSKSINTAEKVYAAISVTSSQYADKMWLFTDATCTNGFDTGWDAKKIKGMAVAPQLYAVEKDGEYQIDCKSTIANTSICFTAGVDSVYSLKINGVNLSQAYSSLYLIDSVANKVVSLQMDSTVYQFKATPNSSSFRFRIVENAGLTTDRKSIETESMKGSFYVNAGKLYVAEKCAAEYINIYTATGNLIRNLKKNQLMTSVIDLKLQSGIYLLKSSTGEAKVSVVE